MAILTACEQAAVYLAEAQAALHAISVGGRVTRLSQADKSIEYSAANRLDLVRYIGQLQDQVDACNGARCRSKSFRIQPSGW